MKILYLPCHSILEYDEVKLLTELGHEVFSMGSYINPATPHDLKRPPIEGKYEDHLVSVSNLHSKDNLHADLVDPFDVVIVQHVPEWIINNWDILKKKKVIWRTIGQSIAYQEQKLTPYRIAGDLLIVRYSPLEKNIPFYIGEDAMIRFYKDPEEFQGWNGNNRQVITVSQSMKRRDQFCGYSVFEEATRPFPRKIYGADNADIGDLWGGQLSYDELKKVLRDNLVFVYTGTQPASYTLTFIEAMMTGIPIISLGKELGNSTFKNEQDTFEVPEIIKNDVNGFVTDEVENIRHYIEAILGNYSLAERIGRAGRETAIELFGKDKIKKQWKEFLDNI